MYKQNPDHSKTYPSSIKGCKSDKKMSERKKTRRQTMIDITQKAKDLTMVDITKKAKD